MRTIYYITGTSRGIGKSLAENALDEENSIVFGFSRSQTINHNRYFHTNIDLCNNEELLNLKFKKIEGASKAILINNSGMLGPVSFLGNHQANEVIQTHSLNSIAPAILINEFISVYKNDISLVIINISSGAARYAVEGWSNYCASKASLDMLSQVVQAEYKRPKVCVFSIAPGIVDTEMQAEIRNVSPALFPHYQKFVEYKQKNQLSNPTVVASKILQIAKHPENFQGVILDLRNL